LQNYKPEIACCGMKKLNMTSSQNLSLILEGIRQEIIIVLTFTAVPTQNHHASVNRYGRGVLARCNSSVLGFQGGCHSKMAQAKVLGQTSHLKIKNNLCREQNKLVPIGMDDQQNFSHLIKKTIQLVNATSVIIILVSVTNQTSISVKEVCT